MCATSQDLNPNPPPGAAGGIWGSLLEPERGMNVPQTPRECLFIYLYSSTHTSGHPVHSQDERAVCRSSSSTPSQHLEDYQQRGIHCQALYALCPLPALAQAQQAQHAAQMMVISDHWPGTLPTTFTHYLCAPHMPHLSWEVRVERFRNAQEPRTWQDMRGTRTSTGSPILALGLGKLLFSQAHGATLEAR